jgi:hypothetical protein
MFRLQSEKIINNSQDAMSSFNPSNPIQSSAGPEKSNVAETPNKDFKVAFVNMSKDLKGDMNKFNNEIFKTQ